MFDKEVIEKMREQFSAADKDSSGEIDSHEAAMIFSRWSNPDATPAQQRRAAEALKNQVDTDRNGRVSFEEYCFRFGRRYQMDIARRRRDRRDGRQASSYEEIKGSQAWHDQDARDQENEQRSQRQQGSSSSANCQGAISFDQILLGTGCIGLFCVLINSGGGVRGMDLQSLLMVGVVGLIGWQIYRINPEVVNNAVRYAAPAAMMAAQMRGGRGRYSGSRRHRGH